MRASGVLMHISSLPSSYGIGTIGKEAYKFIDFLKRAGQSYWQMLPVGPTSYGDSPYQSFSAFAGNPYFIDLKLLCKNGYLKEEECEKWIWGSSAAEVDYEALYTNRFKLFRKVQKRFQKRLPEDYATFCEEQKDWLEDYALFMALKQRYGGSAWITWPKTVRMREPQVLEEEKQHLEKEMEFHKMLQYLFYDQWKKLRIYAQKKKIQMIGDIPIYVALDSADVWANPEQFYLNEDLEPIDVAGCPPDAFCEDGQLWGNPLFRWDVMKKDGYEWWTRRVKHTMTLFDVVRIDHFRGFESYYAIPATEDTARNGEWRKGPGLDLFHVMEQKLGKLNIIAEDLGFLTDSVREMLEDSGYPGMKVLQFAFDGDASNCYLPHHYTKNSVVYTGTHDNDTVLGWKKNASKATIRFARKYMIYKKKEGFTWGMMRLAWSSVSDLAIVTMQDLLELGSEARMNTPSTLGGNWTWRMLPQEADDVRIAKKMKKYMRCYDRLPKKKKK